MISQRAYARHRGVTQAAVYAAIEAGRLSKCVVRDARGHRKITSAAEADAEWEANTKRAPAAEDAPKSAPQGEPRGFETMSYSEARRLHEIERARLAEIKRQIADIELRRLQGEWIERKIITDKMVNAYTIVRNKLLGVHARVKQRCPEISLEHIQVMDDLIREALEELSNPEDVSKQP